MAFKLKVPLVTIMLVALPLTTFAENWVGFHREEWSQKSGKLKRKLNFSSRYYYDVESLVRTAAGDAILWVKEVSDNDKYYVKSGNPQSETTFRKVHLWCKTKKYEIIQADEESVILNESMSEEIKPDSSYEKLYYAGCAGKGGR